jgi:hypothetical protein
MTKARNFIFAKFAGRVNVSVMFGIKSTNILLKQTHNSFGMFNDNLS